MRNVAVVLLLLCAAACEAPRVVDCDTGRFVEAGGDFWCIYPRTATTRCPRLLPEEHELPWGGRGCASMQHSPLPSDLCVAAGACATDGGAP